MLRHSGVGRFFLTFSSLCCLQSLCDRTLVSQCISTVESSTTPTPNRTDTGGSQNNDIEEYQRGHFIVSRVTKYYLTDWDDHYYFDECPVRIPLLIDYPGLFAIFFSLLVYALPKFGQLLMYAMISCPKDTPQSH